MLVYDLVFVAMAMLNDKVYIIEVFYPDCIHYALN
jgi:hypothetical protein